MQGSHPLIMLYMMSECAFCKSAQAFFDDQKIRYTTIDITDNPQAREEMIKKSGQPGVPVVTIGDKVFIGFNRGAIENELSNE
ncbi:glutaredoxin family protein [Patescibacteria group bacterium]